MIELRTVDSLELTGKRVFYRVDYNVPINGTTVSDATRIDATIPTLQLLRERGARIVIASHLGRPRGARREELSLAPVRVKLEEILGLEVGWADDCLDGEARKKSDALASGGLLLLENLRFHAGEESNNADFSSALAELGDLYVNDAFGACHRSHASIVGVPEVLGKENSAAGLLVAREIEFLQKVTEVADEDRPFVAILGGAKIKGKIEPLEAMVRIADHLLIGGGMANTFLAAQGHPLGGSLVDDDSIEVARSILQHESRAELRLPVDLVVTDFIDEPTKIRTLEVGDTFEENEMAVDIGEKTIASHVQIIGLARTVFWNGPMGVFEKDEFSKGTSAVAAAVAGSGATSVVGGGESVEAVNQSGTASQISHLSTGGGASLEFISGASLPGIEVLRR